MRIARFVAPLLASIAACQAHPPPNWAQGGSPLDIPRARWTRGTHLIDIMPDGKVLADGEPIFSIDRAGRVYEPDNEPIAVLEPDGRLVGKDEASLGKVGLRNASLPGREFAWLSIGPQGEVIRYDPEGEAHAEGGWAGCGPAVRACTLATHVVALGEVRRVQSGYAGYGPSIGLGIGFGVMVSP